MIGIIESIGSLYLSTGTRQLVLLLVLLGVLLVRPHGILGKAAGRNV